MISFKIYKYYHQFKGATAVAGYKELLQKGFPVRKGEQGIRILAPTVCQYILDEKGNRKSKSRWNKEEKELISKGKVAVKEDVYYRSVFVFNISQTNAQSKDLPQIFPNRPYNYDYSNVKNRQNLYEELVRIAKETGIDIRIEKVSEWQNKKLGSAKGCESESFSLVNLLNWSVGSPGIRPGAPSCTPGPIPLSNTGAPRG